ncbi:hydrogenase expression/formation protein HypE [Alisedimentitalea sp. MJ-SS2]|uniref:hydrogenase expression/formation protein HypE n=1 Tax=Aliisedimentitalea sp. MJ-SS2 TaxID=3049795 RepID=UPI00290921FF|nr:hydrogenase expression/formation protein HypE [Alisedimentitalea sp. MJ-SS2]MDU8925778.1 hydrogenase expression/formation protein HypE [Alisedimentitalea sp. MJ-SS2]
MSKTKGLHGVRPIDVERGQVDLSHGAGGRAMTQLIEELFFDALGNEVLNREHDAALVELPPGRVVMSTDSFVISPIFFPGGDIGSLSVHGTVNDLAMGGGVPKYLTVGFILEEGFPLKDLKRIVGSMAKAAQDAGVTIVSGDTKVVERGKGDGIFINTAGVGVVSDGVVIGGHLARPGDKVLVSGTLGDHGVAVMSKRENLSFTTEILSDAQSLNGLTTAMLESVPGIRVLRDPTRGGLSAALNEIAQQSGVGVALDEAQLPIRPEVKSACELLGLDPLNVANEGKLVAICAAEDAEKLLAVMREHPKGKDAAIVGDVIDDPRHFVHLRTGFGGKRLVDWLAGEQLPRIC